MSRPNSLLAATIFVCAVAVAPSAEALWLSVDLRTNYRPVEDFAEVVTRVQSATDPLVSDQATLTADSTHDFMGGVRVADLEFAQTADGGYVLNVDLVRSDGEVVASRELTLHLTDDFHINVLIVQPASLTKSFDGPTTATGTAVLTFTIENLSSAEALAGLAFTDDLSATLPGLVATGLPLNDICGAGSTLGGGPVLTFLGGNLGPEASCSFDVTVQVPAGAAPGSHTNTTSELSASDLMVALPASDDLVIEPAPSFSKSFSPATVGEGVPSRLELTIDNTASALAASGLDFTDPLPAGVVVATPPDTATTCTGGTLTAVAGSGTVSYTGGTVAAGASCTVSVDVTAASTGSYVNTSGALTSSSGSSGTASSTLTVRPAPTVTKSFAPDTIVAGDTSTVTVTIDNTANALPVTGLAFTDTLPAGMTVADPAGASTTCTAGTLTAVPAAGDFSYAGGSVAAGASCSVTVEVLATVHGPADNLVVVGSSLGESPAAAAVLQVTVPVTEIPTANTWGLLLLGVLLAAGGLWRLRS